MSIASRAAADAPSGVPGGGEAKWLSGSATPQKTSPMPMPAAKSIANHDLRPNSGSSSSLPSTTLPMGEKATHRENAMQALTSST